MMSQLHAYLLVNCKNRDCDSPIRIRILEPNLPKIDANPLLTPMEDFSVRVVCPECGHGLVCSAREFDLGAPPPSSRIADIDRAYSIVCIECAEPDCLSRTEWHLPLGQHERKTPPREYLKSLPMILLCPNDHSLQKSIAEDRFWLRVVT